MSRNIVACGGGGWASEHGIGPIERHILGMAAAGRPRVCLLPTASGDSDWLVARFYEAFSQVPCVPSHVPLFRSHPGRLAATLRAQDVIYVGGGSTANLMAVWAVHGVGEALRAAWQAGVVLSGVSAGAICWFAAGLTDSLGPGLAPVAGLGLLQGGFCPHADGDPERVPALRALMEDGRMPPTWAVDDGAAIHFSDDAPPRLVVEAEGAGARLLSPGGAEEALSPA